MGTNDHLSVDEFLAISDDFNKIHHDVRFVNPL